MSKIPSELTMVQQGDILFIKVDDAYRAKFGEPDRSNCVQAARINGRLEVMIGESSGHAHAIVAPEVLGQKVNVSDIHVTWLEVPDKEVPVVHEEHKPVILTLGTWEARRQEQVVNRSRLYVYD